MNNVTQSRRCLLKALCLGWFCFFAASVCMGVSPESVDRQDISIDKVYEGFKNPPAEARPFVRWWWNNNQVEKDEIIRELDLLKAAGVGGVEINPIAGREGTGGSKAKELTWRSEEWDRMLHVACKGAKERGLVVDLIAGSGWPFGGEFLKPHEQIMRITVIDEHVTGPKTFRVPIADVLKRTFKYHNRKTKFIDPLVSFIKVYPKNLTSMDQVRNVNGSIDENGILKIDIAKGEHIVAYGIFEQGFRKVVGGTKGAAGPTMDHMQKTVTRSYLNRLKGVEDTWGEPMSKYVRAIFCDSIETAGANWTHGMAESFKKRKGYDVTPFLPMVINPESESIAPSAAVADQIRRARYDWNEHNVSVFLDNFTSEYAAFCHDNNLLSRYQAYGIPYLMGMAEGYMIPDIPESNNWLYSRGKFDPLVDDGFKSSYQHGYMIWTKYTSAGGRLRGKKIMSTEAMTNTSRVFQTTLATIKQSDDMNFIAGMTHSVLHGFNYVPPDVPFPGWIRFGSYFSEHNTWWPYFSLWADYNSRLSYVFQETKPVAEIALLGPTPDIWSTTGLSRDEFHLNPDYFHKLWEPIAQLGAGCDYLHEDVIQNADMSKGMLRYGPMSYRMLIVADMESMQPKTAEAILRFTEQGGKVIYVSKTPSRSPGLINSVAGDKRVAAAMAASVKAGAQTLVGPKKGAELTELRQWTERAIKLAGLNLAMKVKTPRDGLYTLRHQAPGQELMFFANSYRKESLRTRVACKLGKSGLWRWNPETGERTPYDFTYDENGFWINLGPLESILLVTGDKQKPKAVGKTSLSHTPTLFIDSPWTVEFNPVRSDKTFTIKMADLADFTKSKSDRVKYFSGTATYKTTFMLNDKSYTKLGLGWSNDFISEVELNGVKLGVNWYGSKQFDVSKAIKKDTNELTIRYTTTLWNHMKEIQLQPTGLMGPIRLER